MTCSSSSRSLCICGVASHGLAINSSGLTSVVAFIMSVVFTGAVLRVMLLRSHRLWYGRVWCIRNSADSTILMSMVWLKPW